MAATTVNQAPATRLENGSIIDFINAAGDVYTVKLVEPGTYREKPGGYEALEYIDRGVQQTPLEGDERPSEIELSVKHTSKHDAGELRQTLAARDTATDLLPLWQVRIKQPKTKTGAGATNYATTLYTRCYVAERPDIVAGQKFDMMNIKFKSLDVTPTLTAWT